jgi:hypothetical protein
MSGRSGRLGWRRRSDRLSDFVFVALAVAASLGLLWAAFVWLPPWLVDDPGLLANERTNAQNAVRTAGVAGLVAIGGVITVVYTVRTFRLTRLNQLSERYTKAVAQLGESKVEVRLGGIYALERLMYDSPSNQPTIVEVLAAYARHPPQDEPKKEFADSRAHKGERPGPGVHAAVIALARRTPHPQERRLDLRQSDLRDAELGKGPGMPNGAQLRGVDLSAAKLQFIYLWDAQLQKAQLYNAHLEQATVERANLRHANLKGAHLEGANLKGANLEGAALNGARLHGAQLVVDALTPQQLADAEGVDQIRWFRQVNPHKYEELSASHPQHPNANS